MKRRRPLVGGVPLQRIGETIGRLASEGEANPPLTSRSWRNSSSSTPAVGDSPSSSHWRPSAPNVSNREQGRSGIPPDQLSGKKVADGCVGVLPSCTRRQHCRHPPPPRPLGGRSGLDFIGGPALGPGSVTLPSTGAPFRSRWKCPSRDRTAEAAQTPVRCLVPFPRRHARRA